MSFAASSFETEAGPIMPGLSRRRKAAMVVQMMLAQGRNLSLKDLPEDVQLNLTRELGALRIVDRETMYAVAEEFAATLESIGLTAPNGVEDAVEALSEQISPETAARLKAEEAARRIAADPWAQITRLESEELLPILQDEGTEVAAVVLSKLPVAKAATVLGMLPGEDARRITFAVNQTSGILPEAVMRIGQALALTHCVKPIPAFDAAAEARVGAILDNSGSATRDGVLEGLTSDDPDFAEQVRRAIFTFADIPARIKPVDVPNITRSVNNDVLITAMTFSLSLGGNDAEAAEYILANMSQRMADQLREDIGERGRIRRSEGEEATKAITTAIKDSVEAGQMRLIEPDEDED